MANSFISVAVRALVAVVAQPSLGRACTWARGVLPEPSLPGAHLWLRACLCSVALPGGLLALSR